jgi:hypothetical protein
MARLWEAGFDATRGASSLGVVESQGNRPEHAPVNARQAMDHVLYLPTSARMSESDRKRMAAIVNQAGRPMAIDDPINVRASSPAERAQARARQLEH